MGKGYTPLRDDEQDVLHRVLKERGQVRVEVQGWGYAPYPTITIGDKRIQVCFPWTFTAPAHPVQVPAFHMRLCTSDGRVLYEETQSTLGNGRYLVVQEGLTVQFQWDISIGALNGDLMRSIKPGVKGKILQSL